MKFTFEEMVNKMEAIGLTVNRKPITFKAFKELADMHQYGRGRNPLRIWYFGLPENMFGFESSYGGTKEMEVKDCYENYLALLERKDMGEFAGVIAWGNCGIPISCNRLALRVRDEQPKLDLPVDEEQDINVVIDVFNTDDWCIHDASGQLIEDNFVSYDEANTWAFENGYKVVDGFHLK